MEAKVNSFCSHKLIFFCEKEIKNFIDFWPNFLLLRTILKIPQPK